MERIDRFFDWLLFTDKIPQLTWKQIDIAGKIIAGMHIVALAIAGIALLTLL